MNWSHVSTPGWYDEYGEPIPAEPYEHTMEWKTITRPVQSGKATDLKNLADAILKKHEMLGQTNEWGEPTSVAKRTVGQIQAEHVRAHQKRLYNEGLWEGPFDGIPNDKLAAVWNEDNDGVVDFWDYLNMEVMRTARMEGLL